MALQQSNHQQHSGQLANIVTPMGFCIFSMHFSTIIPAFQAFAFSNTEGMKLL
jgi:hypothetical protein